MQENKALELLQYPIGKPNIPNLISPIDIQNWIQIIEEFPQKLAALVLQFSDEQLDTKYRPKGWTVRQVIHHLYDSHHNSYTRFKWTLTEDKPVIKAYFEEKIQGFDSFDPNFSEPLNCMVSQESLVDCEEFVIYGHFQGDKMKLGMFPYALSGAVLDEIADLLSEETLGEIDDFIGEHFTGPPQFKELLKDKKWIFV